MYLEILIRSAPQREALVAKIKADGDVLKLGSTSIRCRSLQVDELISLATETVDVHAIQKELTTWLAQFEPDAVLSGLGGSADAINLVAGEDTSTAAVLKVLAAASSRARNALAVREGVPDEYEESDFDLAAYLEKHRVDPEEMFRGISILQICLDSEIEAALKYFIDAGAVPGDHPQALLPSMLDFEEDGAEYFAKRIAQGEDPSRQVGDGYGLLHLLAGSGRNVEMTRCLLEHGLDPNQVTDTGESPLLLAVYDMFDEDGWDGELEELEDELAYLELLRSFGARADILNQEGAGVLLHVEDSEKLTAWFREHFPEIENTKDSLEAEAAIVSKFGYEEGSSEFYEKCLEKDLLGPFERPPFQALFALSRSADTRQKGLVLSTARRFHALACNHDQPRLLEQLTAWGFPLLLRTQVEMSELNAKRDYDANTVALAHQRKATRVIDFLDRQGLTLEKYEQITSGFDRWCLQTQEDPDGLETVQKYCSEAWIAWVTGKWERRRDPSRTLEESLISAFRAWVRTREKERIFDWAFGTDRILLNQGGMIRVGGGYQLATLEEVLAELGQDCPGSAACSAPTVV